LLFIDGHSTDVVALILFQDAVRHQYWIGLFGFLVYLHWERDQHSHHGPLHGHELAILVAKRRALTFVSSATHIQDILSGMSQFRPDVICYAVGGNSIKLCDTAALSFMCWAYGVLRLPNHHCPLRKACPALTESPRPRAAGSIRGW